ncbi:unnamed protein product [Cuscuta campestris]|uniref:Retrotransposon gag domain-containing protein n=1 Tax=Cuscuta campestris TaxID=132261 RepID=A0A484L3N5_9ASTE|nr:unnamed protein product [Cuscuta campestris]
MVQTRSNVPTTSQVVGEEIAPRSGNGTGGIGSTSDAVQALFGLGVTTEQLQAAVVALSAMGGNVPGSGAGKAPPGPHTEHAATSQHKGKKTRRNRRRPGKAQVFEEVIVEYVPEGEDDESSECRVSAVKRLGGEETRISAVNRGLEDRPGDLRRQISQVRRRHAEESATSDARSARPERNGERRDERDQRRHSLTRTEKAQDSDQGVSRLAREIADLKRRVETRAPYSQPILQTVTPFTARVMSVPLLVNFRPWQIKAYNRMTDPQDHLSKFYASMEAEVAPGEVKCRCFLATLEGSACDWFNRLPKGTIDDWDTLAEKFITHFAANRRQRRPYSHLLNICIRAPPESSPQEEFDVAPDSEAAPAKRAPADSGETAKKRKEKKDYIAGPRTPSASVYSVGAPMGTGRELALSPLPHKEMQRLIARGPPPRDDGVALSRGPPEGRTWRKPTEPVAVATQARNPEKRHIGRESEDLDEDEAQGYPVGFIHGGNISGDSTAQRKKWKHMAFVAKVQQAPVSKLGRREQIQFTEKDLPSPHRDALVMKIEINDAIVHHTLVDTGSSVNIMYDKTFHDLDLDRKNLRPVRTPLSGFTGDSIEAEGVVTMPVIVGDGAHKAKLKMEFMVKLPRDETLVVYAQEEMRKLEARPKAEPAEEVEEVALDPRTPERKVKVGASLTGSQRKRLVDVLSAYRVIFAWGPGDMPGVDPKVICDRLAVNLEARPVKQKKRFLSSERREFVSKEVATLQSIGHIREVKYPEWMANMVLAPKGNTWGMCVDYTDLNKACPMDPF